MLSGGGMAMERGEPQHLQPTSQAQCLAFLTGLGRATEGRTATHLCIWQAFMGSAPLLLVVIHGHHARPVCSHLFQAKRLAHVAQAEDVLLEAGAPKPDAGVQELGANARVCANGVRHLRTDARTRLHVCARACVCPCMYAAHVLLLPLQLAADRVGCLLPSSTHRAAARALRVQGYCDAADGAETACPRGHRGEAAPAARPPARRAPPAARWPPTPRTAR